MGRRVPDDIRWEILERDGHVCVYCGASPAGVPGTILDVDHIKPQCDGGSDDLENLVTACRSCNLGKGSSIPAAQNSRAQREGADMDRFAGVLDRLREDWKRVDMAESDGEVRWAEVMPFIRRHDITAAELTAEIEKHIIGREDDIRAYCDGTGSVVSYLFGILKTARQNHNDRMAG